MTLAELLMSSAEYWLVSRQTPTFKLLAEDRFITLVSASLATANKCVTDKARDSETHLH